MTLTKGSVETFVTNYVKDWSDCGKDPSPEKWKAMSDKYHKDNFCYIRPSGNPMTRDVFLKMTSSGDITNSRQDLIAVNSVNIIGNGKVACAVYTANQYFAYKGKWDACWLSAHRVVSLT